MTRKRILIADDHKIVRDGLCMIVKSVPEYEIVGVASDGIETVAAVQNLKPDLVVMDLSMPKMHGLEAARQIKQLPFPVKILILTVHLDEEYVSEAMRIGADGYIPKHAAKDELLSALEEIFAGEFFISSMIDYKKPEDADARQNSHKTTLWQSTTPRERQILKLIAEGHTNNNIAEMLCISVKTVETHRSNLMKKLGLHKASELTAYAMRKGLVA